MRPHDGEKTHEHDAHGHDLGPEPLHGPLDDRLLQIGEGAHEAAPPSLVEGEVEVEEHEDAGLGVDAEERDQAHPDRDAHVVAERPEEPDGAHGREGHGQQDDHRLRDRGGVQIEEHEDDEQRQGHEEGEPAARPLEVLELPRPAEAVAGRQADALGERALRLCDVGAQVAAGHVDGDVAGERPLLVVDGGRGGRDRDVGELGERDLRAVRPRHQHAPEALEVAPLVAQVAHVDAVALAALDRLRHARAPDRGLDDVLHVAHGHAVARDRVAPDAEVEVVAARRALREGAPRARHGGEHALDVAADATDLGQVGAEDLDPDRGAEAGGEHLGAGHDRHPEDVGHAREADRPVHLVVEALPGHALPPLALGLEGHHRLEHAERRGIGRGLGAPRLAEDALDLGELLEHAVLDLERGAGLRHGHARERRRHVEDRALVEIRHELRAQAEVDGDGRRHHEHRERDREPAEAEHELDQRMVEPHERAAHGVRVLAVDGPDQHGVGDPAEPAGAEGERLEAREEEPHRGVERDRQHGRDRDREVLGEGERLEEPSLLRLEREDGEERDRDHEQREEARPPHLLHGRDDDIPEVPGPALRLPALELLVRLLDHHDGRVDHGADRDRDAAERHDVGREPQRAHGDEGEQHGDRDGEDRDERAREVPEEEEDDPAHDEELFHQRVAEGVDGPLDERRAVVDGDDLDPRGQRRRDAAELLLHAVDDAQRVLSVTHDDHAAHRLALAVELGEPAAQVGPQVDAADVAHQDRGPAAVGPDRDLLQVGDRLNVAAAAHDVLGAAELDQAPAHLVVRAADGIDHLAEREAVGEQRRRVDLHLVLLDEAADGGDLGHALHAREPVAERPVLEGAQIGERVRAAPVDERVLVHPADAGRVGAQAGSDAFRQAAGDALHVLEDAAPRPVEVGAVGEDDVDERVAEHRLPAHVLDARCGDHGADDGVGDLVLDQVGAPPGPVGEDDHLHVGEVGEGVERAGAERPHANGARERDQQDDQEAVPRAVLDDAVDHDATRSVNRSRSGGFPGRSICTTSDQGPPMGKRAAPS